MKKENSFPFIFLHTRIVIIITNWTREKMATAAGKAVELGVRQRVRVVGVTLLRSGWHQRPEVRSTLRALGLTKINRTIYHKNIQPIRGQLLKVLPVPLAS